MGLFGKGSSSKGGTKGFFKSLLGGDSAKASAASEAAPVIDTIPAPIPVPVKVVAVPKTRPLPEAVAIQVVARPKKIDVSELERSLASLKITNGFELLGAAEESDALADTLSSVAYETVRLRDSAFIALGHRQNLSLMADFFHSIMFTVASNGTNISTRDIPAFRRLHTSLKEACDVATSCSQAGWLARMARAEGMHMEFARISTAALAALRSTSVDFSVRSGRLSPPVFLDLGHSMKLLLKELGNGSVEAGIVLLRTNESAQQAVAQAATVTVSAVSSDAKLDPSAPGSSHVVSEGPARDAECQRVFFEYVTTSPDRITADGFQRLMSDMGLFDNVDAQGQCAAARKALVASDGDYDGALDFPEFRSFYGRYPVTAVRLHLRLSVGLAMEHQVYETFAAFAAFGSSKKGGAQEAVRTLDSTRFAKLCRDCGLLIGAMTPQHVDCVYTAAKPREERRMNFDHFLSALSMIADKRGQTLDRVLNAVATTQGPALHGTRTGFVKLHDDKTMHTGVCGRGGPNMGPVNLDLRVLVDRSKEPLRSPRPANGAIPDKALPTRPESPVLSTKDRITNPGPTTPGRGASLLAREQLAAARAVVLASPRGQASVFGRSSTPRANELAAQRTSRIPSPGKQSPSKPAAAAAKVEVPMPQAATSWMSMDMAASSMPTAEVQEEAVGGVETPDNASVHNEDMFETPVGDELGTEASEESGLDGMASTLVSPVEEEEEEAAEGALSMEESADIASSLYSEEVVDVMEEAIDEPDVSMVTAVESEQEEAAPALEVGDSTAS